MKYGVCCSPEIAVIARDAGFDYFEWSVGGLLKPLEEKTAFEKSLRQAKKAQLPCPVLNGFIPGDLKITGPEYGLAKLKKYVSTAFERAEEARVKVIVFGSGGARHIPDGFDRTIAHEQVVTFCKMFTLIAQQHNVTVVVEPLNSQECNILTTVGEAARLVREVKHPNLRLLVDSYHWAKDNDSAEDIIINGPLLEHVHIATVKSRRAPGTEECDFTPFFIALKKSGYNGRLSIEAKIQTPTEDLPHALSLMKSLGVLILS